jgi:hypothetical protein
MSFRTDPIFTKPVAGAVVQAVTANAARDGSGTIATLSTGTADGIRIDNVRIKATVTTTAGMIKFFYSPDSGTTNRLIGEVVVPAITVGAGVAAFEFDWVPPGGYIDLVGTTDMLRVATTIAEIHNLYARQASYAT